MNLIESEVKALKSDFTGFIKTFTGKQFSPFEPDCENICIEDIAHSLSNQCRFAGHTNEFYSVAQHSRYVSEVCFENPLAGLLHDATEAFFIDMPSPIKKKVPGIDVFEKKISESIEKRFKIKSLMSPEIKLADKFLFDLEWIALMGGEEKIYNVRPFFINQHNKMQFYHDIEIIPESPKVAEEKFLERFYLLTKNKNNENKENANY